jgi:16S rRNA A1518/A1519 N6-dimethyltransferase RsmA/KsgA/DIM1 with predicted DNA glycosylase/AP lyase activity
MINFDFKKSLGQNFLHDENIIDKIVKSADIDKDTLVIEIGPGAGALSKKTIPLSGYTILYEIDTRLKEECEKAWLVFYMKTINDFIERYRINYL